MSAPQLNTLLKRAVAGVAVSLCFLVAPVAAQTQAPPAAAAQSPTPVPSPAANTEPDLSITGSVTARELRFDVVPTPKVEFPGRPRRETVWEAERTNLPAQVEPGVTYRDLGIRLKITSVFADIERIVAEALGEIPTSDDAAPRTNPNDNPQTPSRSEQPPSNEAARPDDAPRSVSSAQTSPAPSSTSNETSRAPSSTPARPARAPRSDSRETRRVRP